MAAPTVQNTSASSPGAGTAMSGVGAALTVFATGDLIAVAIGLGGDSAVVSSVTDTQNLTWIFAGAHSISTLQRIEWWYAKNATVGSTTVTANFSALTEWGIVCVDVNGTAPLQLDSVGVGTVNGASNLPIDTITTISSTALVLFGASQSRPTGSITPNAGTTYDVGSVSSDSPGVHADTGHSTAPPVAATPTTYGWTLGSGTSWAAFAIAFSSMAGSPGPTVVSASNASNSQDGAHSIALSVGPVTVLKGDGLYVALFWTTLDEVFGNPPITGVSVSDTAGNVYNRVQTLTGSSLQTALIRMDIYKVDRVAAGSVTVNATSSVLKQGTGLSTVWTFAMHVLDITQGNSSLLGVAFDRLGTSGGSSVNVSETTTTTAFNELVLLFIFGQDLTPVTYGGGQTALPNLVNESPYTEAASSQPQVAIGAPASTATLANNHGYLAQALSVANFSGSAPPAPVSTTPVGSSPPTTLVVDRKNIPWLSGTTIRGGGGESSIG